MTSSHLPAITGLEDSKDWKVFQHDNYPGFVLIRNPFERGYQRYWAHRCLYDYPVKPSRTNLDIHNSLSDCDNIWQISMDKRSGNEKPLIDKLRWSTLGYHHNWDTKEYSEDNHTPFPGDLAVLAKYVAAALGWASYTAEAAIINYYHLDSTLAGHTDHSEFDHEAPLISVSFGQTAIFLVGGETRQEKPLAVYLRSGDIAVMMGPRRLAYHAIPRVMSCDQNKVRECFEITDDHGSEVTGTCYNRKKLKLESTVTSETHCEERTSKGQGEQSPCPTNIHSASVGDACAICDPDKIPVSEADTVEKWELQDRTSERIQEINKQIAQAMERLTDVVWEPFSEYLDKNRINMNIRQVFETGQGFPLKQPNGHNKKPKMDDD